MTAVGTARASGRCLRAALRFRSAEGHADPRASADDEWPPQSHQDSGVPQATGLRESLGDPPPGHAVHPGQGAPERE